MAGTRRPQPELHGRKRRELCEYVRRTQPNCWICGNPIDLSLDRQTNPLGSVVDEKYPRSKSLDPHRAAHTLDNLGHAHRLCNGEKGDRLITEERTSRVW